MNMIIVVGSEGIVAGTERALREMTQTETA
jgi:hypothetical protein